jgi:hypothetical protein
VKPSQPTEGRSRRSCSVRAEEEGEDDEDDEDDGRMCEGIFVSVA